MKKLFKVLFVALFAIGATFSLTGCSSSSDEDKTITIGACATPHADILNNVVKDILADEGYTLEVTEFEDYVTPNTAVEEEELFANYFQHINYLDSFNEENGTHLVAVAGVHLEPMGAYSKKVKSIDELSDGATVAVPDDTTNEGRALSLLADNGLITLKEGVANPTKEDIESNPKNIQIKELEAAQTARALDDVDLAVINGNYALDAGLTVADAVIVEDANSDGAYQWINYIVVKEGNEDSDKVKALVKAIQSDEVKAYIEKNYGESVIPAFTDPKK